MRRALVAIVLFAGCGNSPQSAPSIVSLNAPVHVSSSGPAAPSTALSVHVVGGVGQQHDSATDLTLRGLNVGLTTDGEHATLDAFDLPIADIDIGADTLPPHGLSLRDLRLWAPAARLQIVRADRDSLEAQATLALKFSWAMLLDDGTRWTLDPVTTPALPLTLQVTRGPDGATTVHVSASCAGVCWAVEDLVAMSDLSVELDAAAAVEPAQ